MIEGTSKGGIMYSTILWATDGAAGATDALKEAVKLLEPDGRLVAFHANQLFVGTRVGGLPVFPDEAERVERLERQVAELRHDGVAAELWVESTVRSPVRAIAEAAECVEADVIVCSARVHHALLRMLEGSVSSRLIHEAAVPVVVVPQAAHGKVEAQPA
jgi:nucleotide-binding universal stress UspA family protein